MDSKDSKELVCQVVDKISESIGMGSDSYIFQAIKSSTARNDLDPQVIEIALDSLSVID